MAAGTMSDITRAPCDPPVTSSDTVPPGCRSGMARCDAATTAGRTGLPVKTALAAKASGTLPSLGKPVAIRVARLATKRLALPITAFCSCSTIGTARIDAATMGGTVG